MLRIVVLAIALTIALANDRHKCHKIFHPESMRCCKTDVRPEINKDDLEECFKMPPDPHTCEHDICIAKKRGFASDDGTVDTDALEKIVTEDFKNSPTLIEAIKENCINGDLSKVGPPDGCQLVKIKMCTNKMIIMECKDWDNSGPCTGMKDLVRECAKMDD